jgi:AcrR family transcriptional regulator
MSKSKKGSDNPSRRSAAPPSRRSGGAIARDNDGKALQILEGALRVFLADGFDGASMNDIARAAGVSKGTLYVYFPSKAELFERLIRHERAFPADDLFGFVSGDEDFAQTLTRIGLGLMSHICFGPHLAHMRMVIAVAAKYPQIGQAYYESGPKAAAVGLGVYLERQMERGLIPRRDPVHAADQFIQLCQTGYFKAALFCAAEPDDAIAIQREVTTAVSAFLALCGLKRPGEA